MTFWGFEWSSWTYGHIAVVNTDDYCTYTDPAANTFSKLGSWLAGREGIAFLNHPGRENKDGEFDHFTTTPNNRFVGMELWNGSDPFSVYYYNDGYFADDGNKGYYDEANIRGWKIGAAGSEDNHGETWGTWKDYRLAVLAPEKTRAAIYDALKERRFYSTLDKNLVLSFEVNDAQMGSVISPGTYDATITAGDGNSEIFTQIILYKNGSALYTWTPNSTNPQIAQQLETASGDYYYVKVTQADGNEAISSPVYIQ